jgi:hypothetical protein
VTTTNANADAGRSSGAQVSLVTKSGTNQFHGGLYEYNRNTIATANNWFNKQAQIREGLPNVPGKLIRNTFGGTAGGPVKKDKLFFFFNYEGQRTAENQQVTQVVPTAKYRAGFLTYLYDNGASTTAAATLTPSKVSQLDVPCIQNAVCPWGSRTQSEYSQSFRSISAQQWIHGRRWIQPGVL